MPGGNDAKTSGPGGREKPDGSPVQPLSRSAKILTWIGLPAFVGSVAAASPVTTLLIPIMAAPTVGAILYERHAPPEERTDPTTLFYSYVFAGTVGITGAMVLQGLASFALAKALFGPDMWAYWEGVAQSAQQIAQMDAAQLAQRAEMAGRWQYWVFIPLFNFGCAAVVEELFKYAAISGGRRYGRIKRERDYVALSIAAGLGFSMLEGVGFILASAQSQDSLAMQAATLLERTVIGSAGHTLTSLMIGMCLVRRDFRKEKISLAKVLGLSVFFHGTSNSLLFFHSAWNGHLGFVHPTGWDLLIPFGFFATTYAALSAILYRQSRLLWP